MPSRQRRRRTWKPRTKRCSDKQAENNKLVYRVTAMQFVLGLKGTTKEDVDLAKSQAGGDDAEVKEILDNFDSRHAHWWATRSRRRVPRSYRTINTVLLAALNKKNASVSDAIDQSRKAQQDKDAAEQAAAGARRDGGGVVEARRPPTTAPSREKFAADRAKIEEEKIKLNSANRHDRGQGARPICKKSSMRRICSSSRTRSC